MLKIKDYLASIDATYEEYRVICATPYFQWTQSQQLLVNMLDEAANEGLIRRIDWINKIHQHLYAHDREYREKYDMLRAAIRANSIDAIGQQLTEEAAE